MVQRKGAWPFTRVHRAAVHRLAAAIAVFCVAAPFAVAQDSLVPPPAPATMQGHSPQPEPAASARPVDLRPRPLGQSAQRASTSPIGAEPRNASGEPAAGQATSQAFQTALSLGLVLAIILALAAGVRRLARSRGTLGAALGAMGASPAPAGILEVLGRYPIARGTSIILLKVDRRVLVLSQTGARIRGGGATLATLCEIADPEEVASIVVKANEAEGRSIGTRFREALRTFERAHDGVVEQSRPSLFGRLVSRGSGGDTTELLDAQALAGDVDPLRFADFDQQGSSVVGSLRSRLSALRAGGAA